MKFKVLIELQHVSGPARDEETMLDAFAATIGEQNTARHPLHITSGYPVEDGGDGESVYLVKLVDDA